MARILAVDDSPVARALIRELATLMGHKLVGEAENLAQTLQLLESKRPDVVTLDLSMGQEDGFQVLKGLRQVDKNVKVLIISANTQGEVYEQLLKEGASGFLTKPFSAAGLGAALEKAGALRDERSLTELFTQGASKCAASLREATGAEWTVEGVQPGAGDGASFAGLAGDEYHYGSRFSIPGAAFLVMFSGKSGYVVAHAFTRGHLDRIANMDKLESRTVAEVANIFLNPLLSHLAAAWKRRILISAPETQAGSQTDLIAESLAVFKKRGRLTASFFIKLACGALSARCLLVVFLDAGLTEEGAALP